MLHEQKLPARYVDKEKLGRFWETNDDFKGKGCGVVDVRVGCSRTNGTRADWRGHRLTGRRRYRTRSSSESHAT